MITAIRGWLADRIFDLWWAVAPENELFEFGEAEEAGIWPWCYGLAISRATVASWAGHPGPTPIVEKTPEVDHAGARLVSKGLIVGLLLIVAAWGSAWLLADALHALGLV